MSTESKRIIDSSSTENLLPLNTVMPPKVTKIGITKEMMAGGRAYTGSPAYVTEVKRAYTTVAQLDEQESASCRSVAVALTIIALLVAIGASALIVLSGGPSAPQLFAPGVAFAVVTLSIVVWVTVLAVSALCKRRERERERLEVTSEEVVCENALQAMEQSDEKQISSILATFGTDRQRAFIDWFLGRYFAKEMDWSSTSVERVKVLKAFAKFPEALAYLPEDRIKAAGVPFGRIILTHINPDSAKKEAVGKFLTTLFTIVIPAISSDEDFQTLARHPVILAQMALTHPESVNPRLLKCIFPKMAAAALVTFLQTAVVTLNDLKAQATSEEEKGQKSAAYIRNVGSCIECILNSWGESATDYQSQEVLKLLQELAHWPKLVATEIFGSWRFWSINEPFLNQLYPMFSPQERAIFISEMRDLFKGGLPLDKIDKIRGVLEHLAYTTKQRLPEALLKIFAQFPQEIALLVRENNSNTLALLDAIRNAMTEENRRITDSIIRTA